MLQPQTLLTIEELYGRIKYDSRTIRNELIGSVPLEGVHYFRPFGRRKILYIWEKIQQDMTKISTNNSTTPMANAGLYNG